MTNDWLGWFYIIAIVLTIVSAVDTRAQECPYAQGCPIIIDPPQPKPERPRGPGHPIL